ncbi:WxL domain-containing protein [Bacillaceae bacterium CLA-AA-H227]|uniref:WxL domain-containing protein n=1 Tax=Robertmurraya yapensis (ex Hitch et al 2024) TaxID=3133160 RepID=A0ACC6SGN8_9BACI
MKNGLKKKIFTLTLGIGLFSAILVSGSALAETSMTTKATQAIQGGEKDVSINSTTTFDPVVLNGEVQTTNANPGQLNVTDASGTGEGWRIQVSASQFTEKTPSGGFAAGTTAKKLPQGSLSLSNSGSTISAVGTTSASPTWVANEWILDNGSAVNILSAAKNAGMGKYTVAFGANGLSLTLAPNTTFIDSVNYPNGSTPYESTITYTIVTGP